MLFLPVIASLLSITVLPHTTLAEQKRGVPSLEPCLPKQGTLGWQTKSFGDSKGSPFCMMNLEQYVVRKITTWTDAGKLQRIKLLYANNVPDEIVNLPQLEGGKINELDLHPGNKTIKNVYGDLASGQGLLDGIAVTLSGGDTLYAGKELTVPEFDNSTSWLYLVGISGFTGTYGIEQINFHVAGQLSNKTGPIARRQLLQWKI